MFILSIKNSLHYFKHLRMSCLFRSEEMCLVQLFFQKESAHNCINELGHLGLVQFKDLNPGVMDFQRRFVKEVKKCEEMERILRYLEKEMVKSNIVIAATKEKEMVPCPRDVLELESTFEKLEQELREINRNHDALRQNLTELMDIDSLLRMTENFFEEAESLLTCSEPPSEDSVSMTISSHMTSRRNSNTSNTGPLSLGFIAGVIKQERFPAFEKVLWRLFHGNFVLRHAEIQDTEEFQAERGTVKKDVFIIFVQGDHVRDKIRKVCDGFHANLYTCPKTLHERKEMRSNVITRMEDLQMIQKRTEEYRASVLTKAADHVQEWGSKVKKMKSIYYTLNLCNIDITQKLIVAEIWCPVSDLTVVYNALIKGSEQSGSSVTPVLNRIQTQQTPPTFNRTNAFTEGFQAIIDAYGVGTYQEINPAPYTIVTFPFLFAVMFGDCGHGLVMTIFAVWIINQAECLRKWKNEITDVLVSGRYIILLMGMFSIYTGLIYNDCFSKSFNIFGSSWCVRPMFHPHGPWHNKSLHKCHHLQLDPVVSGVFSGDPYVFGIDPVWNIASNKLSFLNSFKMKMSVILGVSHMLFGVTLSLVNYVYFQNFRDIVLQFVPQLIFILSLFGYLVFLILYKWSITLQSDKAPSILLLFINMMLFDYQSQHNLLYGGQKAVQIFLVVTAVLVVPVLLLAKPLFVYRTRMKTRHQVFGNSLNDPSRTDARSSFSNHQRDETVSMGDIFVYQAIHTIEYCLGCISNTASYLRLWALSLAHAELSEVLWRMVLQVGLKFTSGMGSLMLALLFAAFALLTVTVLLLMESLSAFLHALRLHWVEFQNKFYEGSGYKFTPLSFGSLLKQ
ncbi:V-type proton ATPase 116 kDa subunit a 1 isoform X2 [Myxocyprinus asiaticus]|uniref:V-type proton ATPase 116 kDa subunit a 1 isoform X2 n=1 Tax=Myxocyprinus asiaticus TaxID=70543 RepID=UPI002223816A|nr:V-type proton ATPase 116 kDa subunit a 1 isoform X2 [Myxocyprinus asiaticus]